jgi:hypothetical protein
MITQAFLDRLTARQSQMNLTDTDLSAAAGSTDLVRNWRRSVASGKPVNPKHVSLSAVADKLAVTVDWLLNGEETGTFLSRAPAPIAQGLSEEAVPFQFDAPPVASGSDQDLMRAIFGAAVTTPATYRMSQALPAFGLNSGDVVIVELSRLPQVGEIAIVSVYDEGRASAITTMRRYLPPYLGSGTVFDEDRPMRVDDPGVTVRYPVVGSIRGIKGR